MKEDKKILSKILSEFLGQKEFGEFQKLLLKENSSKKQKVSSSTISKEKQLKVEFSSLPLYSNIDLLITFSQYKLKQSKLTKFLLFIGEDLTAKGLLDSAEKVFSHLLSISPDKLKSSVRAKVFYGLGDIYSRQAFWEKSISYLNKARIIFKSINDKQGMAKCENILGTIKVETGELKSAKKHFESALSLLGSNKPDVLIGMLESNIGILENIQGNYDQAYIHFQRALFKFEKDNNHQRLSEVHHNLGMVYLEKKNYKSGIKEFDRAFTHASKADVWQIMCISCINKAYIYNKLKDYSLANAFAVKAMDIAYKINDRLSIADIYKIKGVIEKNKKNYTLSENYLNTSLRINIELENILNQAEALYEMGFLYKQMRDFKKSRTCFNKSLNKYNYLKIENKVEEILEVLKI
ncbi:MAG: tetratricopeptide repeat protein [Bacteroidetes bacterium]|nr:tetratricopeptide repeat protein [Bacteroidota bacterium]